MTRLRYELAATSRDQGLAETKLKVYERQNHGRRIYFDRRLLKFFSEMSPRLEMELISPPFVILTVRETECFELVLKLQGVQPPGPGLGRF